MRNEAMEAFVERVSEQTDILRIVQGYVPLKRRGNRYWGCCPFHQEKTASFSVLPDKGFFYCFGCHAGGNAFKFISLIENISYFDAIKLQAEKLGIPLPERKRSPQEVARDREIQDLRKVNELARDFIHTGLTMTRMGERGKAYFAARGIRQETIEEFQLGYAPPAWDKLSTAFLKRGIKQEFLLASGLCAERKQGGGLYDRFRGRVIIPIADERGRVVGFGGRVLDDSTPKYLNTPETVLFNKRKLLFGLDRSHRAIQQEGRAIVVEGYMDAISVFDAGVHNVVASLGTSFTPEHAKKLLHYAPEICFCYDSDEAGQKATIRALSIVRDTGARVRVIVVPDGKDPDEFIRKHGADAFRALVEKALPLVEYRLRYVLSHTNYDTLDGKVKALHEMMPVLAGIREAAVRSEYERRLAQTLMLDEGIVRSELRHYRPEAEEAQVRQPIRKVVAKPDTALRKAGRLVIRMAWQDAAVIAHLETIVPLEGIRDPAQREILTFLKAAAEEGRPVDDMSAATLSDEAAAELSRSLAEDLGGRDETEAYDDSLRVLRKAYLNALYTEHSRKANEYAQNGQHEACLQELNEVNKIKHEMDEW
ncbi:DNA primase [Mitsuokella multacida]|uniref:DNA primase n=1 Tax=Mitsuokella multacida TaxID=52226 RepID=UPI003F7E9500